MLILAIESSCDETAAAVVRERQALSNVIASQVEEHQKFGGVVPRSRLPPACGRSHGHVNGP